MIGALKRESTQIAIVIVASDTLLIVYQLISSRKTPTVQSALAPLLHLLLAALSMHCAQYLKLRNFPVIGPSFYKLRITVKSVLAFLLLWILYKSYLARVASAGYLTWRGLLAIQQQSRRGIVPVQKISRSTTDGSHNKKTYSHGKSKHALFLGNVYRNTLELTHHLFERRKKTEEPDTRLETSGASIATNIRTGSSFENKIEHDESNHSVNGSAKPSTSRETYESIRPHPPVERLHSLDRKKSSSAEVPEGSTSTSQSRVLENKQQGSNINSSRKDISSDNQNGNMPPFRKSVKFLDTPTELSDSSLSRPLSLTQTHTHTHTPHNRQAAQGSGTPTSSSDHRSTSRNGVSYSEERVPKRDGWSPSHTEVRSDNIRLKRKTIQEIEYIEDLENIPSRDLENIPCRDLENIPSRDFENIPGRDFENIPSREQEYNDDEDYSAKKRHYPFSRHGDGQPLAESGSDTDDCDFQRKKRIGLHFQAAIKGARALIVRQGGNRVNDTHGHSGYKRERDRIDTDFEDEERKKRSMLKLNGESPSEQSSVPEGRGVRVEPVCGRPVLKRTRKTSDLDDTQESGLLSDDLTGSTYTQRRVELIKKRSEIMREANRLAEGM
jgi:hypothetical protein